jgi:hypothetical protein
LRPLLTKFHQELSATVGSDTIGGTEDLAEKHQSLDPAEVNPRFGAAKDKATDGGNEKGGKRKRKGKKKGGK